MNISLCHFFLAEILVARSKMMRIDQRCGRTSWRSANSRVDGKGGAQLFFVAIGTGRRTDGSNDKDDDRLRRKDWVWKIDGRRHRRRGMSSSSLAPAAGQCPSSSSYILSKLLSSSCVDIYCPVTRGTKNGGGRGNERKELLYYENGSRGNQVSLSLSIYLKKKKNTGENKIKIWNPASVSTSHDRGDCQ